jgi:chromate transport protein ChrA
VVSFYRIGTFLIGGTPIMLPFLFSEITTNNLSISEDAMWIGFALAAAVVINIV